jgi:hypothetical protein
VPRFGRRLLGVCVAGFAALYWVVPAPASTLPNASLHSPDQVVRWHGSNPDATGQGYGPPTEQSCTESTCDSFLLTINLPAGTFPKGPLHPTPQGISRTQAEGPTDMPGDGVLVSVHWGTDFDQWNLYVDDTTTGQTVAQGTAVDSNAQSVLLSQPHNGTYRVRIVPFYTDFNTVDLHYQGEARVFLDPTQRQPAGTQLLPKIQTVAPNNFHIGDVPPVASNPTGWRFTPNGTFSNSCYTDETAQYGSTRCLRFDNDTRNLGSGPMILRFTYDPQAFVPGSCDMTQEIIVSGGTVADRSAGPCLFHPQHGHFHYQNYAIYQLFGVSASGQPSAQPVAASHKVGFCTIDVDDYNFGLAGGAQRPRTYSFPACNIPNAYSTQLPTSSPYFPSGLPEYMGISPGWGDVYTWDLPAQYIDISNNVPDGVYEVVSRANFDNGILTSDTSQQTGVTCVRITASDVRTIREFHSQSNSAPLPLCPHQGGAGRAGPTAARLGLPSVRNCASQRSIVIHLRHPPGEDVRRARVFVNGHRVRVIYGRRVHARINLRGLPRRTVVVRVVAVTSRGRRLTETRTYHTCRPGRGHRGQGHRGRGRG